MRASLEHDSVPERTIVINGRFAPHTVVLAPGRGRLVFRREETSACSAQVMLPTLGLSAELPPFQDIVVELPDLAPGTYPITCQRGALSGRIVVRGRPRPAATRGDSRVA